MKSLFITAMTIGILQGTAIKAKAQPGRNVAGNESKAKPGRSFKFIESIELVPQSYAATQAVDSKPQDPVKMASVNAKPVNTTGNSIEKCTALEFKYALLTDREVESITNKKLYNFIEEWWGTRYSYGGCTKSGVDCSAFAGKLMQEVFGLPLQRTARDQYDACEKIAKQDLLEGDLVFFNTTGGVSHVGVYLGNGYFVHSSVSTGVTISALDETYYSNKFVSAGRVNQ